MMESLPPTHHEEPLSPSLPQGYSAVRVEPTTDFWNPPLIHPASGVSENIPTYTSLEPVYPESSYAPTSTPVSGTSNTIQPLYSSCSMMQDEPLLHSGLYRDPDVSQTARDEGLGSSPSSFSSTTPPLRQNITNGHIVGLSRQYSNIEFSHRITSSYPESTEFFRGSAMATPLIHPASGVSENIPTYTSLEPVYPESSYAPTSTQYLPVSGTSNTIQPLYSSCSMMQDEPLLHSGLYRDPDVSQTARDEGLGSSPSSFSSTTPPLRQNITNGHIVGLSRQYSNIEFSHRSTSSYPESTVSSNNSTASECSNCGNKNDLFWVSTHCLCRQCLPEKVTIVQQPLSGHCSGNKRKRSRKTNKNENDVCTNCEATLTTLWRRNSSGNKVCNACGLYEYLRHCPRPKHMKKDTIQRRKRKPKVSQASKVKSSSRKRSKKSTSESNLSPQYMPNEAYDRSNYTLPNYNTLQMTDFFTSVNNTHLSMLPPINGSQPFYAPHRPEMYNIYNSMPLNEIINIPHGLPCIQEPFNSRYSPEMYNIYNSMPLNEIVNIPHGLPSNIHYASS